MIDRRVEVHSPSGTVKQYLSELRQQPYIVIIGEPGMGKSTALRYEATAENGEFLTCREAMSGGLPANGSTAYLDALDEYRSGDNGKDKLIQLASALLSHNIMRWRLTCRAEDWREASDLKAMRRAVNNEPIIVAHLLPLTEEEAEQVLFALGEPDPTIFIETARNHGAGAFLESPLSLDLLRRVVLSVGQWPTSRFDLFNKALDALAYENDPDRTSDPRPSANEIIETASTLCFYFLVTGAKALWRSNNLPPNGQGREYVSVNTLGLEKAHTDATLDTALFRGEGKSFQPFHKTIAEFLAARFAAKLVAGDTNVPAFPLRRALAVITSKDLKAPSELRGLYAWFAVHLHQEGDAPGALQLIERDAATVLIYGDAAAFDTNGRKAILYNIDRDDPYFLSSQDRNTVLGALAGEDLADDFIQILDSPVRGQVQITVLLALADGAAVFGVQNKLHEIVLEHSKPQWMRERAADVIIKNAIDKPGTRRVLLQELQQLPLDPTQIALRIYILSKMQGDAITAEGIRQVLSDFLNANTSANEDANADDDVRTELRSLTSLTIALSRYPCVELFDAPVVASSGRNLRQRFEITSFVNQALASAISASPEIGAERLWQWIRNSREHRWDMLDSVVVAALNGWLDIDRDQRELDLFLEILKDTPSNDSPSEPVDEFISTLKRLPGLSLHNRLLNLAHAETQPEFRRRLFQVAAYATRAQANWSDLQQEIRSVLEAEGESEKFIHTLLTNRNESWQKKDAERKARDEETLAADRNCRIAELTSRIEAIASGSMSEFNTLKWASQHYRSAVVSKKDDLLASIVELTNQEITAAIAEGFIQFAIGPNIGLTASDLGKAQAENHDYYKEYVIAAGVHQALLHGRDDELATCANIVALIALRQNIYEKDAPSIAVWGTRHLVRDLDAGAAEIVRYWHAALDAGAKDLSAIYLLADEPRLLAKCLAELLHSRPNLPVHALTQALTDGSWIIDFDEIRSLVTTSLARDDLETEQRDLWIFAALNLMPRETAAGLQKEEIERVILAPEDGLASAFIGICPEPDYLDELKISMLAGAHPADEDDWRRSNTVSGLIRAAIRRLSASKAHSVTETLKLLASQVHSSWQSPLLHAAAEHAAKIRDELFTTPSVQQLQSALAGGPPVNSADLAAIALDELHRYKATLRTGSETPWKRFWNTDPTGAATTPLVENEARDRLLELLRIRFEKYGIIASLPEARRGENTRADILLLSNAGRNLPIEAKRHFNPELWTAPTTQLAGYAADEGASGVGIYLVFWFGTEYPVPSRIDSKSAPKSAEELGELLQDDIPIAQKDKLKITVLDMSRPASMIAAVNARMEKKRKKRTTPPGSPLAK